ncbi:MAG TPA: CBS domain-containing protein [Pseudoxanthomonas sp.]|nr:CBS domain-containing protein [Pseudoxanthomonas sp.]
MKVDDMMSSDVRVVPPDDSLREAAKLVAEDDIGSVPVGGNARLQGVSALR